MRKQVEVENIAELRRREGIDDVELWKDIGGLRAGDFVKLSLILSPTSFETVCVRITSIQDMELRGKLVQGPISAKLAELKAGSSLRFNMSQIHSVDHARKTSEARKIKESEPRE